jgi:hypothetical protein
MYKNVNIFLGNSLKGNILREKRIIEDLKFRERTKEKIKLTIKGL